MAVRRGGPAAAVRGREHYRSKLVRDRFPVSLLRDYLRALGLDAFEQEFYLAGQPATLVTEEFPDDSDDKYVELAAWQSGKR